MAWGCMPTSIADSGGEANWYPHMIDAEFLDLMVVPPTEPGSFGGNPEDTRLRRLHAGATMSHSSPQTSDHHHFAYPCVTEVHRFGQGGAAPTHTTGGAQPANAAAAPTLAAGGRRSQGARS